MLGGSCGNITIESTVHLTATAGDNNTKAITTNGGGTVIIGGAVYADGTNSPFVYPAPAGPVTYTELNGGEVLKPGEIITPTEEVELNGNYYIGPYGYPFTVVRANVTSGSVTEDENGCYYIIKYFDGQDTWYYFK